MYVRLAFAVAAHLETEILLVDEVLAVGDAEFQRRSLAKMRDVAADGRTVLYVSHQMQTVSALCTSAMFLRARPARVPRRRAPVPSSTTARASRTSRRSEQEADRVPGTGELRATSVTRGIRRHRPTESAIGGGRAPVGANPGWSGPYFVSVHVNDSNGIVVAQCDSRLHQLLARPDRRTESRFSDQRPWLKPGRYTVDVFVCQAGILDAWEGADAFEVLPDLPVPRVATAARRSRAASCSPTST